MALFKLSNTKEEPKITKKEAQKIYSHLRTGISESEVFTKYSHKIIFCLQVTKEMLRIESLINSEMTEEMSKKDLLKKLSSDLLDVDLILDDVVLWYDGDPSTSKKWEQFQKFFKKEI